MSYLLESVLHNHCVQLTLDTQDVFVEVTATDSAKAEIVLNTICAMFSVYCSTPYQVEPVRVLNAFGQVEGMSSSQQTSPSVLMAFHLCTEHLLAKNLSA